jgi:hypothetical protein
MLFEDDQLYVTIHLDLQHLEWYSILLSLAEHELLIYWNQWSRVWRCLGIYKEDHYSEQKSSHNLYFGTEDLIGFIV